jgi:hypothetical protein
LTSHATGRLPASAHDQGEHRASPVFCPAPKGRRAVATGGGGGSRRNPWKVGRPLARPEGAKEASPSPQLQHTARPRRPLGADCLATIVSTGGVRRRRTLPVATARDPFGVVSGCGPGTPIESTACHWPPASQRVRPARVSCLSYLPPPTLNPCNTLPDAGNSPPDNRAPQTSWMRASRPSSSVGCVDSPAPPSPKTHSCLRPANNRRCCHTRSPRPREHRQGPHQEAAGTVQPTRLRSFSEATHRGCNRIPVAVSPRAACLRRHHLACSLRANSGPCSLCRRQSQAHRGRLRSSDRLEPLQVHRARQRFRRRPERDHLRIRSREIPCERDSPSRPEAPRRRWPLPVQPPTGRMQLGIRAEPARALPLSLPSDAAGHWLLVSRYQGLSASGEEARLAGYRMPPRHHCAVAPSTSDQGPISVRPRQLPPASTYRVFFRIHQAVCRDSQRQSVAPPPQPNSRTRRYLASATFLQLAPPILTTERRIRRWQRVRSYGEEMVLTHETGWSLSSPADAVLHWK